jgi:hypothetical protein
MNRISFVKTIIAKSDYKEKEEVEGGIYLIHFDPTEKEGMDAYECVECSVPVTDYNTDEVKAEYETWKTKHDASELAYAIRSKVAEIEAYDTSSKVNGFVLNGMTVWLDKATRVGLMNSTTIAKAAGQETTTLWLGDVKLEVDCDKAIQLLSVLEMYALECFNVTAAHKAAVAELKTIKEVEAFDVTADYPKQLEMKL